MTARVGNLLYFWLQAHRAQQEGRQLRVRESEHFADWAAVWPAVTDLSIPRLSIGRTDRLLPVPPTHFQQFGTDFTRDELRTFVRQCLLTDAFTRVLSEPDPAKLTVNVRRGDYYDDPDLRDRYGFDLAAYLRAAVESVAGSGGIERVVVVSDDPAWCAVELAWLAEVGPVDVRRGTPVHHLATLASASNLVLSNSTFSYWGAYIAGTRSATTRVLAPSFHVRDVDGGAPWQHDPSWEVVAAG
ncbi:alpha-1,2-fucosyltransferase [Nocardioides sp. SYSU D00065]|uniref:alpha-1,2-fucosyltransferase n=1 Tax=Nocardioides sp. SYSU D00065 TaxID=2817378 RepID=UPI001B34032F|nr:alpha-1,2-fucosyltransferase [Nocardioides sp. SYSU D00065]